MNKSKSKIPLTGEALLAIECDDLRSAGYSASELRKAGYPPYILKLAGYRTHEIIAEAGYRLSELREAGFSASEIREAGFSTFELREAWYRLSELDKLEKLIKEIPKLDKPYSKLWEDIQNKKRFHEQSTWGPDNPCENICGTPMCTAGHLVNMAGSVGYKLKDATSWEFASEIIHQKAHPNIPPPQSFKSIPQELALAYIQQMAEFEENDV